MTTTINASTSAGLVNTADTSGVLQLQTANTTALTVDGSQNVGIGTASPSTRLHTYTASGGNKLTVEAGAASQQAVVSLVTNATTPGQCQLYMGKSGATTNGQVGYDPNSDYMYFYTANSERMRIDSSGNVGIGTTSPSTRLSLQLSSATTYTTSTRTNQGLTIYNSSATTNGFTGIEFNSEPTSGNTGLAGIGSVVTGSGSANLVFGTRDSSTYAERMRIDSSGNLLVGVTANPSAGGNYGVCVQRNASGASFTGRINIGHGDSTGARIMSFYYSTTPTVVGTVDCTTTSTSYNTSSDYRLKENIAPMTGALAKVSQLKPVTYKWKADGSDGEGFIAHELQEVVAGCVTGAKDAVDEDGKPVYQGIDTSFLVATLTAALQETKALIDTQAETINALTARIVALEGK